MKRTTFIRAAATALAAVAFVSCTTRNSLFVEVDQAVEDGDYSTAITILESKKGTDIYPDQDKVLRELDLGMLKYLTRDLKPSIDHLGEGERMIEENFTRSITEAAGSFLLNDSVMAYPGEAYEDIYLNVFKALNYARKGEFDGAFVEIRRMNDKMGMLEEKYGKLADSMNSNSDAGGQVKRGESEFSNSALAHFLSALLYRADGRLDDAALDLRKIDDAFRTQANIFDFPKPDFSGLAKKSASPRMSVVAFSGRSPVKKAKTYRLFTTSNRVTISLEEEDSKGRMKVTEAGSIFMPGVESGFDFKCQVPYMERLPQKIQQAEVEVDGTVIGSLALIEKMDSVALDTFKVKEPIIYTKTIIRTIVKGIATKLAQKGAEQASPYAGLIVGLGGAIFVEASEQADLRSARFYPARALAGDFEIPEGTHKVQVIYRDKGGKVLYTDDLGNVDVKAKGLNLVSSMALM